MKPEFTKPFNLADARAGAPYVCKDGQHVEILKWDCNHPHYPIIGVICEDGFHYPESWTESGTQASDEELERRPGRDLVMLPLGLIAGRPVFVGDQLVLKDACRIDGYEDNTGPNTVMPGWSNEWTPEIWQWPAPEKVYPKLTQADINTWKDWCGKDWQVNFANAALRHAIDAGQVAIIEKVTK